MGALIEAGFRFNWDALHPEMWDIENEPIDMVKINRAPYIYQSDGLAMAALQVNDPDDNAEVTTFSNTLTEDCVSKLVAIHRNLKAKVNSAGAAMPSAAVGSAPAADTTGGDVEGLPGDDDEGSDLEEEPAAARGNVYFGDLKASRDPTSAYHLCRHFPSLRSCPTCVDANSKKKAHRRKKGSAAGAPSIAPATKFGDLVNMDFVSMGKSPGPGI